MLTQLGVCFRKWEAVGRNMLQVIRNGTSCFTFGAQTHRIELSSVWVIIYSEKTIEGYLHSVIFLTFLPLNFQNSIFIFQTQIIGPLAHFKDASIPSSYTFIVYSE